ncbi:MAG TPA: LuxR C-terminal-related transcriptional regulator [Solirubrobacteraceae bacterium]|nr:LuxR C-terminal-related transcriptional regulator [Solirubrobacteraceae bacterium]
MTDQHGYMVILLEDSASLWPRVRSILPEHCIGAGDEHIGSILPEQYIGDGDEHIGLIGWSSAKREETARLAEIRARHAGALVAVLAEVPSARGARIVAARLEGAVLASELEQALLPTLQAVAVGQCVVPRSIRQIVDRPALSPRERQILAMIVLDFSNAEIARKLFVTESNVKNHLSSAFGKLGVSSRSAAAELILDGESGLGPGILRISPEESLPSDGTVGVGS